MPNTAFKITHSHDFDEIHWIKLHALDFLCLTKKMSLVTKLEKNPIPKNVQRKIPVPGQGESSNTVLGWGCKC